MEFLKVQNLVLFFSSYISMIYPNHNSQTKPIFFADDTSIIIIIYHSDSNYFQNSINDVFANLNKWFKTNKLILDFDKKNFMEYATNN
jgi:hypothetical protein